MLKRFINKTTPSVKTAVRTEPSLKLKKQNEDQLAYALPLKNWFQTIDDILVVIYLNQIIW